MYKFTNVLVHSRIASEFVPFKPGEVDDVRWFVGIASGIIARECRRTFIRPSADVTEYYNVPEDKKLSLRNWPVHSITSLRYDPSRAFDDADDDIDDYESFTDDGVIYLPIVYPLKRRALQILYIAGYEVPKFMQETEPGADDSELGDIWTNGTTIKKYSAVPSWDDYETEIVPEVLMQAVMAYAIFIKKKIRAKEVGVKSKERGYAFEGSSINYELGIPDHIKGMFAPYVSFR